MKPRQLLCSTLLAALVTTVLFTPSLVSAADAQEADQEKLLKALQNPVSDLVSVPFQNNTDFNIGPHNRVRDTLNIQPVIPLTLTRNWNVVMRFIVPLLLQPDITHEKGRKAGLGDTSATFFVAPSHPGGLIWGVGPALLLPTATSESLGTGKWGVGPSFVVLVQPKPWTLGILANNIWSFAGSSDRRNVNQALVQYFINRNFKHGWYFTSSPIITANWQAPASDTFIVPFGGGIGKLFAIGKLPINGQVSAYYNAIRPDTIPSPSWQLRIQLALLFPTSSGGQTSAVGKATPSAALVGL